ncbi:MAG: DNA double-strand break repair nuclease NurA [Halobacteriaceae archaeon]
MTLERVHIDGIARLARRISRGVDEREQTDAAERVWESFLDPLVVDGDAVLEPLDGRERYRADAETVGLQDPAFGVVHGLDAGTVNERLFRNGLTIDVAQAAMSATPTDLDLHRSRSIVVGTHTSDDTVDTATDWDHRDEGYVRLRTVQVALDRANAKTVHWLALYLAESAHAHRHADDVEEVLVLDGPLYPKQLVKWADGRGGLADLGVEEPLVATVLENYVGLVERFVERDIPLVGFVKGARSRALVRSLAGRTHAPWATDMALFAQVLGADAEPGARAGHLTWTNWFVSRLGADRAFSRLGDPGVERSLPADAYEVCFFVVHDARTDLAFKVELPYAFAADPSVRERVRRHVLRDVAAYEGPPESVQRADGLAGIDRGETASLVRRLEDGLGSREDRTYDDERWSGVD